MFKHFKGNLIYERKKERNEQNRKAGRIARKKNTNLGRKIINKEIKWGIKSIRQGIKIYPKDHADLK